jgi:hypothetical protein
MTAMKEKIEAFKAHVRETSKNPDFIHHAWFVKWHLDVVERIALELLAYYPEADRELVEVMVWLHDYGKTLDFAHQYEVTLSAGRKKLQELQFPEVFTDKAISYIETLDKKMELDLRESPIEVQIVSSADGCSHLVGPFLHFWWDEHPNKTFEELMQDNRYKADKDWNRKIVLPEARKAFESRYKYACEEAGDLPAKFL